MNYKEREDMQISNIISNTSEFKKLAKQCLSITQNATAKDDEIVMWINGAISDMIRQAINVQKNINDGLVQGAIMMYVKGNFGMVDIKEKQLAKETYTNICCNLSLSEQYKLKEEENA